jgi:hypothetical protein
MSINIQPKPYPYGYSQEVVNIIKKITFSKGDNSYFVINGSAGITSQMYYGDYDIMETVDETIFKMKNLTFDTYINLLVERFQNIIKRLLSMELVYIGDIKCGEIPEWNVSSVSGLTKLLNNKIITEEEYNIAVKELKCETCSRSRRFGVIRWKPEDILKGYKILRDGRKYTLADGIKSSSGMTKLDVITYIHSKFTEISVIYRFKYGEKEFAVSKKDIKDLIYETGMLNYMEGKFFKVIKRMFSLARIDNDDKQLAKLTTVLNSDLGRLYSVISDLNTILYVLENVKSIPKKRLNREIQEFRSRLANVYTLNHWMKLELYVLKAIYRLQFVKTKKKLYEKLTDIDEILQSILNYYTLVFLLENTICVYGCKKGDDKIMMSSNRHKLEIAKVLHKLDVIKKRIL